MRLFERIQKLVTEVTEVIFGKEKVGNLANESNFKEQLKEVSPSKAKLCISSLELHFVPDEHNVQQLQETAQVKFLENESRDAYCKWHFDRNNNKITSYTYAPMIQTIQRQFGSQAKIDDPVQWPRNMDVRPAQFNKSYDDHENEHVRALISYVMTHKPPEFQGRVGMDKNEFEDLWYKHKQDVIDWRDRLLEHNEWAARNIDRGISWDSIPPTPREMKEMVDMLKH